MEQLQPGNREWACERLPRERFVQREIFTYELILNIFDVYDRARSASQLDCHTDTVRTGHLMQQALPDACPYGYPAAWQAIVLRLGSLLQAVATTAARYNCPDPSQYTKR